MLKDIRQQVQTRINNIYIYKGNKSNITAPYDRLYSDSFITSEDFLRIVYNDLILVEYILNKKWN
jgi:hypothetical protein